LFHYTPQFFNLISVVDALQEPYVASRVRSEFELYNYRNNFRCWGRFERILHK